MPKYGFCNNNKIQCVRQSSRGGGGVRRNMFSAFTQTNIDNTYTPGSGVGAVSRANRRALLRRAANNKCCAVKKEEQDFFFLVFYDSTLGEWYVRSLKANSLPGSVFITLKQFNETYTEISGNLIILDGPEECKVLLKKVGGLIFLPNNQNLPSVVFPNLTMSSIIVIDNNKSLTQLQCPKLTTVNEIIINDNDLLPLISFPELTMVSGNIEIIDNNSLNQIQCPKLTTVGNSLFINNKSLTQLQCPKLTTVNEIFIRDNDLLPLISFPELTKVSGNIDLVENNSLNQIQCPKLTTVGNSVFINNNQNLSISNIYFPQLTTADLIYIFSNLLGQTRPDSFKSIGLLSNNQGVKNISGIEPTVFINSIDVASVDYLKTIFISGQTVNGNITIAPY